VCEFCHQHGEGKKWYLQAKNYSDDLLADIKRRQFIEEFFKYPERIPASEKRLDLLDKKTPRFVRDAVMPFLSNRQKRAHFGQVVPLEDVEKILGFTTSVVRTACICRQTTVGSEQRYCYALSMLPQGGKWAELIRDIDVDYLTGPGTAGLEILSREETLKSLKEHEQEGLCHTVWTFITPFIGGVCNCDRTDCYAMRFTLSSGFPVMFRAEYVAEVSPELCAGCRECMRFCQFGALSFSAATKKAVIDKKRCYGCGVCRAACQRNAIRLLERIAVPETAKLW
jgi:ferredoxin